MESRTEARRRKILQNSEARLKKLTGHSDDNTSSDGLITDNRIPDKWESDQVQKQFENYGRQADHREDSADQEFEIDSTRDDGGGDRMSAKYAEGESDELYDGDEARDMDSSLRHHNSTMSTHESARPQTRSDLCQTNRVPRTKSGIDQEHSHPKNTSSLNEVSGSRTAESRDTSIIVRQIEMTRLVSCILMGLLSRWLLSNLLGYLFLQSAALLFFTMEAALFAHQKNLLQDVVLPHRSNLMAVALAFCGIKPELITLYNRIMGIASTFFEDIILFFFTFITCHILVS